VLNNAQGELTPLEIGLHALGTVEGGMTQGLMATQPSVVIRINAARVLQAVSITDVIIIKDRCRHLSESHSAPKWLWSALVAPIVHRSAPTGYDREIGTAGAADPLGPPRGRAPKTLFYFCLRT
jgi:hypothetical protein